MDTTLPTPDEQAEEPQPRSRWHRFVQVLRTPRPRFWMITGLLGGIILPVICIVSAMHDGSFLVVDKWQSGQPDQYARLMTKWPNVGPFYPLLIYCMVCCGLVLFGGQRWINKIGVRFGIYSGVPLAIQFHVMVFPPNQWNPLLILPSLLFLIVGVVLTFVSLAILLAVVGLLKKAVRYFGRRVMAAVVVTLIAGRIFYCIANGRPPEEFIVAYFGILILGTIFATTTYLTLSWHVWRRAEDRRFRVGILSMLAGLTWIAGYLAAWRSSVLMTIAEYETLPIEQPTCYVCTAAAKGHASIVGSFAVTMPCGSALKVNRQLQTLKAAEIALKATLPTTHHGIRIVYDRIGPVIALRLRNAWMADVAYVSLKPIEWPVRTAFWLIGIRSGDTSHLYVSSRDDSHRLMNPIREPSESEPSLLSAIDRPGDKLTGYDSAMAVDTFRSPTEPR